MERGTDKTTIIFVKSNCLLFSQKYRAMKNNRKAIRTVGTKQVFMFIKRPQQVLLQLLIGQGGDGGTDEGGIFDADDFCIDALFVFEVFLQVVFHPAFEGFHLVEGGSLGHNADRPGGIAALPGADSGAGNCPPPSGTR